MNLSEIVDINKWDKSLEDKIKKYGITVAVVFVTLFIVMLVFDIYSFFKQFEFPFKSMTLFSVLLGTFAIYSFSSAKKISMPTVSPTLIVLTFVIFELCVISLLLLKYATLVIIIGFLPILFAVLLFYKETFNELSTMLDKCFKFILLIVCVALYAMVFMSYDVVDEYEYAKEAMPKAIESIMSYQSDYEESSAIWGVQKIYRLCEKITIEDKENDYEIIGMKSLPLYNQITYEEDYTKDFTDNNYEGIIYKPDEFDYENKDFARKYNVILYFNPMYDFNSYIDESESKTLSWIFIYFSSAILTWYEILIIINTFRYSQKLNDKLKEKNASLEFVNEELYAQRKELEEKNEELLAQQKELEEKNCKLNDYQCVYEMMTAEFDRNTSGFQNEAQNFFTPTTSILNDLDKLIHDVLNKISIKNLHTDSEINEFLNSTVINGKIEEDFLKKLIFDVKDKFFNPVIAATNNALVEVRNNTLVIIPKAISLEEIINDIFERHIGIDASLLKDNAEYKLELVNNISDLELKNLSDVKVNLIPGKLKSIIFYLIKNATIAMDNNHPEIDYAGKLLLTVGTENKWIYIELRDNSGDVSELVINKIYYRIGNKINDNKWKSYIDNGTFIKFFVQNMMNGKFKLKNYSNDGNIIGIVARVYLPFA